MSKAFAYVGKWEHDPSGNALGFDVFAYDAETGGMTYTGTAAPQVTVGAAHYDGKHGVLYAVDEIEKLPGCVAGGGRIYAFRVDRETGMLTELNHRPSLGVRPSYVTTDAQGKYLICTNHSGKNPVTKAFKGLDGKYHLTALYDDANTVLFSLNEDGSIGEALDMYLHTELGKQTNPHPHCVVRSPLGELFIVNDKGGDRIYVYAVEDGRLILKNGAAVKAEFGSAPRYGVFHPTLPYYFMNTESAAYIAAYRYDEEGRLTKINTANIVPGDIDTGTVKAGPRTYQSSDLRISPDGKYLYNLVRGMNTVCVCAIDQATGAVAAIQHQKIPEQEIPDGQGAGHGVRGCCLSPDGRFLEVAAFGSGDIITMAIGADGRLTLVGKANDRQIFHPANITIVEV